VAVERELHFSPLQGFCLGRYTTFMHWFGPTVLKHVGWEFDVAKLWPSEVSGGVMENLPFIPPSQRTLCIYHPRDEVIHYDHSSLHLGLPPIAGNPVFRRCGTYLGFHR
jgi:hypothetical protein